jgi:hypothetical protein
LHLRKNTFLSWHCYFDIATMSSENLLKNSKKRVVIVGAGAAGMVSQDL